ncbi:response regulator transcription factor [Aquimarina sp. 2201CG1-2-11]|uniref:LytR/AlgR family response regulator transcription factor n=1 Tax=Aquimarina discodermiae TaxID=3231043 RepID=UPI003462302E
MENINILILEDNPKEADSIQKILTKNAYDNITICTNVNEAEKVLAKTSVDLCILDIFLGKEMGGIALAQKVSMLNIPFLFLTSSKDKMVFNKAKLTNPISYLLKPFNELELMFTMELAIEKFFNQFHAFSEEKAPTVLGDQYLFVKNKDRITKIEISNISYIQIEDGYCKVVYQQNNYFIKMSLKKITQVLPSYFIQTHRNSMVNLHKIKDIFPNDNLITLMDNEKILISERYKYAIIKKLNII